MKNIDSKHRRESDKKIINTIKKELIKEIDEIKENKENNSNVKIII